eukprot:JP446138.1.p1 GENE.JP446138.1~~JP446138.1.p1  ORF type:complete len:458 (+),score=136.24 JP446138.1:177-1376(+)
MEDKLFLVKETLYFMLQKVLKETDRLGLVTFDSHVETIFPLTNMSTANKQQMTEAIKRLMPGSLTNLSGGLFEGMSIMKNQQEADVGTVLLFTDGQANNGLQKTEEIVTAMEGIFACSEKKCTVFAFGFGKDHDENMLRGISDAGSGIYYFIGQTEDIASSFGDCLGGLISVVAQNLKLNIVAASGVEISKPETSFTVTEVEPGKHYQVVIGDLYAEEERDILLSCKLPLLETANPEYDVAKVTLEFVDVVKGTLGTETCAVQLPRTEEETQKNPNEALSKQLNRVAVVKAMTEATEAADRGDYAGSIVFLNKAQAAVQSSPTVGHTYCASLIADLTTCKQTMSSRQSYADYGSKLSKQKLMSHQYQRCNRNNYSPVGTYNHQDARTESYVTKSKSMFR